MGAYEFSREGSLVGIIENGTFISKNVFIIPNAETYLDIKYAAKNSYYTRVIKVTQSNMQFLRNKSVVLGKLRRKNSTTGVLIKLYNLGVQNGKLIFQTQNFSGDGKPTIFVSNSSLGNEYEDAYVIYCLPQDQIEISISHNQFSD